MKIEDVEITIRNLKHEISGVKFDMIITIESVTDKEIRYVKKCDGSDRCSHHVAVKGQKKEGQDVYSQLWNLCEGLKFLGWWHTS